MFLQIECKVFSVKFIAVQSPSFISFYLVLSFCPFVEMIFVCMSFIVRHSRQTTKLWMLKLHAAGHRPMEMLLMTQLTHQTDCHSSRTSYPVRVRHRPPRRLRVRPLHRLHPFQRVLEVWLKH